MKDLRSPANFRNPGTIVRFPAPKLPGISLPPCRRLISTVPAWEQAEVFALRRRAREAAAASGLAATIARCKATIAAAKAREASR